MDFDQILEAWRAQNTAPPYGLNHDALWQSLRAEEARNQRFQRHRRRVVWFMWLFGTGMAIWAGFWIAITIANGWPVVYAMASGACLALFALGASALWASRGREPEQKFANSLEEEVRRSLARVDGQLAMTKRQVLFVLGAASIVVGARLVAWVTVRSQDIPVSSGGSWWWTALVAAVFVWVAFKARDAMRNAKPKLELRQRRLRELLAALGARE
jgi:cytochrome bd-type quinol oxidase subunit 2